MPTLILEALGFLPTPDPRLGHAISYHGNYGHTDTGDDANTKIAITQSNIDSLTQTIGANQRSNHQHGDARHNGLIKTQHHGRQYQ